MNTILRPTRDGSARPFCSLQLLLQLLCLPDLEVTTLSISPTSQVPGGSLTVTYRVHNSGSGGSTPFDLTFYYSSDATITIGDTEVQTISIPSVAAGAYYPSSANGTVAVTLPYSLSPGSGYFGSIADPGNVVSEVSEGNNSRSAPITILPPITYDCDIDGDGKEGLAEAIHALQVVSGLFLEENTDQLCDDHRDNDGDGYTDCDDFDCDGTAPCF